MEHKEKTPPILPIRGGESILFRRIASPLELPLMEAFSIGSLASQSSFNACVSYTVKWRISPTT